MMTSVVLSAKTRSGDDVLPRRHAVDDEDSAGAGDAGPSGRADSDRGARHRGHVNAVDDHTGQTAYRAGG
jgi:hypothetical protein